MKKKLKQEIPLCVECEYYCDLSERLTQCTHPLSSEIDIINGNKNYLTCKRMRFFNKCGKKGKLFVPKKDNLHDKGS